MLLVQMSELSEPLWATRTQSVFRCSPPAGLKGFCLCWSSPKRLYHHVIAPTPKVAPTSPNYFHKSLLNVLSLFCYTNWLKCFPHFHMLTHSLKISFNPSLVARFLLRAQRNKSMRVRKGAKYSKKHLPLIEQNHCNTFCQEIPDLQCFFF